MAKGTNEVTSAGLLGIAEVSKTTFGTKYGEAKHSLPGASHGKRQGK